ncbi:MFS transporter [Ktedonosporobacter rubrisoli]|uniref:MFS transporter n=1 Tax=Ktedonosporobacter rubrisoli TaxID=2509675 RepID=A0A4P6JJT1_KTERU|nr:MFS transporter [Ktedonosporobacter rubrisoli]QBD75379.1 MFS transporter [Ktedonosporobacter rubrisoli]
MKRIWWALLTFTLGVNLPSPLYPLYQARFHLTTAVITLLFAIYALFLLPSLLFLGPLADSWGRKRLMIPALALMGAASLIFAFADQAWLLFVGRALQGLATGSFLGACTALLLEQAGKHRQRFALLLAGFTTMVGFGLGPGFAGMLIQYVLWHPFQASYFVHVILLASALLSMLTVKETILRRKARLRVAIGIPRQIRRPFWSLIAPAGFLFFAFNGTIVALIPTFSVSVLHIHNLAMGGVLIFLQMLIGGLTQVIVQRSNLLGVTRWGVILTIAGAFVIISAAPTQASLLLLGGIAIEGAGNGLLYKGSFDLAGKIGTQQQRAQIISSYYVAAYIGFSVPVFAVGIMATFIGLTGAFLSLAVVLTFLGIVLLVSTYVLAPAVSAVGQAHVSGMVEAVESKQEELAQE